MHVTRLSTVYIYIYRLVARDTGLPLAAPLLRGYAKVELLTIAAPSQVK